MKAILPDAICDGNVLLAGVLAAPKDDAPRLVLADWLDDHDGPVDCDVCEKTGMNRLANGEFDQAWYCPVCDGRQNGFAEWAEFIRVQCELARMGPPHVVVNERCVLERKYGPNYYTLTGGEGTEGDRRLIQEVKVGDRVDVLKPRGNKGRPLYGLRVHKITDDEVIVVNDAKSGPWPGAALHEREQELWKVLGGQFLKSLPCSETAAVHPEGFPPGIERPVRYIVRRGFVAEVRLTCTAFEGGPCATCDGSGYITPMSHHPNTDGDCSTCSGCGRLPGLAATLFKLLPIETVALTDKRPLVHGSKEAYWHDETDVHNGHINPNSDLPRKLFDLLTGEGQRERMLRRWSAKIFASSSLAVDSLNRACIQWGRSQTGLPELS